MGCAIRSLWHQFPLLPPPRFWETMRAQSLSPRTCTSDGTSSSSNLCCLLQPTISHFRARDSISVNAGEFILPNKHLIKELSRKGLWTEQVQNKMIANKGSIQSITTIPQSIRAIYKTSWEIPQRTILKQAADRGPFICQSQSMNIHMAEPSVSKLTSLHFHAWKIGLKTGVYYLRTKPKADAIQFTVDHDALTRKEGEIERVDKEAVAACSLAPGEGNDDKECCFCGA